LAEKNLHENENSSVEAEISVRR